ncbi:hypothetical protein ADJ73_09770 [Arsenicicoccus sp. oral taxon 190]|nr:hypothetical protein ADJ73_09770 [Arsenicicoccus sp. oral taxon 190]
MLQLSPSQLAVRALGLACCLLVPVLAPSTHELAGAATTLLVVAAGWSALRPEPGGVASLVSLGVYLTLAPMGAGTPLAVLVAALVLAQLSCLVLAASAPPEADLDPAMVRRQLRRWATVVAVAAVTWLLARAAVALAEPGGTDLTPLVAGVAGLVGAILLALALLGPDGPREG